MRHVATAGIAGHPRQPVWRPERSETFTRLALQILQRHAHARARTSGEDLWPRRSTMPDAYLHDPLVNSARASSEADGVAASRVSQRAPPSVETVDGHERLAWRDRFAERDRVTS